MIRVGVVVYPGSNCDGDCVRAVRQAGGEAIRVWHKDRSLPSLAGVILPGGFSYGDYLRPGAIAGFSPISDAVRSFARDGGAIIGICNGFQILAELGLLPGALRRNKSLRFRCRDQWLLRDSTRGLMEGTPQRILAPIAHADGAWHGDTELVSRLEGEGRVAYRYCDEDGLVDENANPNGSTAHVAGVLSENGRILGMMPHPERNAESLLGNANSAPVIQAWLKNMEAWA